MKSVAVLLLLCGLCQAHIKMNSFNGVSATTTSRNQGVYSTANTDGCGGNAAVGANGLNEIWPGQPLALVWQMNDHAALPSFRIAYSPDGSEPEFAQNVLVSNIAHTGAGVYSYNITAPKELCTACSVQVLHTGYDWAGCFDLNIVAAPCGGSCAQTGEVENGSLNYATGEVTCDSGYELTSENTCKSTSAASSIFGSVCAATTLVFVMLAL